jgi:hypothetical protein
VRTVNEHLSNIYHEQELDENATIRNFRIVQKEAAREVERKTKHYNLDAILENKYFQEKIIYFHKNKNCF